MADCAHCGTRLPPPALTGRTRLYCDDRCRWLAFKERHRYTGPPRTYEDQVLEFLEDQQGEWARLLAL